MSEVHIMPGRKLIQVSDGNQLFQPHFRGGSRSRRLRSVNNEFSRGSYFIPGINGRARCLDDNGPMVGIDKLMRKSGERGFVTNNFLDQNQQFLEDASDSALGNVEDASMLRRRLSCRSPRPRTGCDVEIHCFYTKSDQPLSDDDSTKSLFLTELRLPLDSLHFPNESNRSIDSSVATAGTFESLPVLWRTYKEKSTIIGFRADILQEELKCIKFLRQKASLLKSCGVKEPTADYESLRYRIRQTELESSSPEHQELAIRYETLPKSSHAMQHSTMPAKQQQRPDIRCATTA
jgi:hypothetical protein